MYQIKVSYQTGDSFGSSETDTTLDMEWNNIEVAKSNLIRIEEHYELYELENNSHYSLRKQDKDSRIKELQSRDWFRTSQSDKKGHWSLFLLLDDRKMYVQSVSWCGYFESLIGAEIIFTDIGTAFRRANKC